MIDAKYQGHFFFLFCILVLLISFGGQPIISMLVTEPMDRDAPRFMWFLFSITVVPYLIFLSWNKLFEDRTKRDFILRSVDLHSGDSFSKHTECFLFNDTTFQIPGACKKFYINLEITGEVRNTDYGCATDCNPVLLANLDNYVQFSEQALILCQIDEHGCIKFKYMGREHNRVDVAWELGKVYTPQPNAVPEYPVKGNPQ